MKYAIISTYPAQGSLNIGDALITNETAAFIRKHDPSAQIEKIWRASCAEDAKKQLHQKDHIIFACLAIRGNMNSVYSMLEEVVDGSIPFSIIAAGTSVDVNSIILKQEEFSEVDRKILKKIEERAHIFTTRDNITQRFCRKIGLTKAFYTGDVAFGLPKELSFSEKNKIRKIIVSDPHYSHQFLDVFCHLISELKKDFADSVIECAMHGENANIERICKQLEIKAVRIYEDPDNGLSIYDDCDLHVGFRLHGHVSALSRGKPSYLLEQDGRGAGCGLSLGLRISTPCFYGQMPWRRRKAVIRDLLRNALTPTPLQSAPEMLLSMIESDRHNGFKRFSYLEQVISDIRDRNDLSFKSICQTTLR